MKILAGVLSALILVIQYPLWLGKGGWLRAWDVDRQVDARRDKNAALEQRNGALAAEVRDLKQGFDAIEERARYELGMVKGDWLRIVAALALPAAIQAGVCVALLPVVTNFVSLVAALLITLPIPGVLFYLLGFADADDRALLARLVPRRG